MTKKMTVFRISVSLLVWIIASNASIAQENNAENSDASLGVSGILTPIGKPINVPKRIDAGESCIIDLKQAYTIAGSLSGTAEIDYRIIIAGKCGMPPATFDEEWIAYGTYTGSVNGKPAAANLSYTAHIKSGGDVDGIIVMGQGIKAKLIISGNFSDNKLSYKGQFYEQQN